MHVTSSARSVALRWRVLPAAIGSLVVHLAVVLGPMLSVSGMGREAAPHSPSMVIRMLAHDTSPLVSEVAAEPSDPESPSRAARPVPMAPVQPLAPSREADPTPIRPVATAAATSPAPSSPTAVRVSRAAPSLPAAPAYRSAAGLDPGPKPLDDIEPVYPAEAGHQVGSVVLRLLIDEKGKVDDASIVRATPPGLFDSAAVDAFAKARFSPGMLLGLPVKSQITIEVEFTPINRGAAVSLPTY